MKTKIALIAILAVASAMALYTSTAAFGQPAPEAEKHPEIRKAIQLLLEAEKYMKRADHDFGGHREAALKACYEARLQLNLAIAYDKK